VTAETPAPELPGDAVPRRWWDSIRSEMDALVLAGASASEFALGAKAYRDAKAREKHARYTLARMNELEHGMTLEAALGEQEAAAKGGREGGGVARRARGDQVDSDMRPEGRADVDR